MSNTFENPTESESLLAKTAEGQIHEQNLVTRIEKTKENGEFINVTKYHYDDLGRCIEEIVTDSKGSQRAWHIIKYDENGNKIEVKSSYYFPVRAGGKTEWGYERNIYEMQYDTAGNLSRRLRKELSSKGEVLRTYSWKFTNEFTENGRNTRETKEDTGDRHREDTFYKYDRDNKLLNKQLSENGVVYEESEYVYNKKGELEKIIRKNKDKRNKYDIEPCITSYEYDDKGNMIKEKSPPGLPSDVFLYKLSYLQK